MKQVFPVEGQPLETQSAALGGTARLGPLQEPGFPSAVSQRKKKLILQLATANQFKLECFSVDCRNLSCYGWTELRVCFNLVARCFFS